jgi:hypothetical protein
MKTALKKYRSSMGKRKGNSKLTSGLKILDLNLSKRVLASPGSLLTSWLSKEEEMAGMPF